MNIYVGNLSRKVRDEELKEAFEAFGQVTSATVIKDRFTGESKGFGFVEMPDKAQAEAAIATMNGKEFKERTLNVNEARPRTENSDRRPMGGNRGGFGGERRGGFGGSRGGFGGNRGGFGGNQ